MEGGKITGNNSNELFNIEDSEADIKGVIMTDNASDVMYIDNVDQKVTMTECTLGNNTLTENPARIIVETKGTLVLNDCEIGDTTFNNRQNVNFGEGANATGSIFGVGSLSMLAAFVALIASGVAIFLVVFYNKKKTVPATAAGADTADGKE